MSEYAFIDAESAQESVAQLCRVLEVPQSAYYQWQRGEPSARARRDAEALPKVRQVFFNSRKTYGSPRVHIELVKAGELIGRHRVARLMRQDGLDARPRLKKRVCGTDSRHDRGFADNLVGRHFDVEAPNRVWVGDVKYIETDEGFVYLAAFTDLFSRRVVGWHVADHKRDDLPIEALRRAFALRSPAPGLIVHTDHGSEFASAGFRKLLQDHSAIQSMSRKANCYDNAVAESVFASVEKDLVMRYRFKTKREAIAAVVDYIQNFYNPRRRHSYNGFLSPEQTERRYAQTLAHAA